MHCPFGLPLTHSTALMCCVAQFATSCWRLGVSQHALNYRVLGNVSRAGSQQEGKACECRSPRVCHHRATISPLLTSLLRLVWPSRVFSGLLRSYELFLRGHDIGDLGLEAPMLFVRTGDLGLEMSMLFLRTGDRGLETSMLFLRTGDRGLEPFGMFTRVCRSRSDPAGCTFALPTNVSVGSRWVGVRERPGRRIPGSSEAIIETASLFLELACTSL